MRKTQLLWYPRFLSCPFQLHCQKIASVKWLVLKMFEHTAGSHRITLLPLLKLSAPLNDNQINWEKIEEPSIRSFAYRSQCQLTVQGSV